MQGVCKVDLAEKSEPAVRGGAINRSVLRTVGWLKTLL
jgi:hypothetical protein